MARMPRIHNLSLRRPECGIMAATEGSKCNYNVFWTLTCVSSFAASQAKHGHDRLFDSAIDGGDADPVNYPLPSATH